MLKELDTTQKLFDHVVTHLLEQGRRSTSLSGKCYYRSPDGLKCAVGACIDDAFYANGLERRSACCPTVRRAIEKSLGRKLSEIELDILQKLQLTHDTVAARDWRTRLWQIACQFDLNGSVIEEKYL